MNYKENYDNYIEYIKQSNRRLEGYTEKHHIIPKCLGGTDNKENLIELTAREHFLAHYLLTKIYPLNYKLIDAFRMMGVVNYKDGQKRYINSRLYESKRILFSEARSKKVLCIETGEIYPSASYIEKNIINGVRDVIYGRHLTAGGYHWKYLEEEHKPKKPFERKKVICANNGIIFDNTDEAAKFANVNPSLIRRICNGSKNGNANGYTFYYYDGEKEYPIKEFKPRKQCKIICIETGEIFETIKQASKTKSDSVNICKCCKGIKQTHKGLHWKYYDEYIGETND